MSNCSCHLPEGPRGGDGNQAALGGSDDPAALAGGLAQAHGLLELAARVDVVDVDVGAGRSQAKPATEKRTCCRWMDDGRLTDGQGRTVDFKNTVLIMTSNIPGGRVGRRGRTFKPEFINRLDDIVEFSRSTASISARSSSSRSRASSSRVRERGIEVKLTDGARTLLGDLGYDPAYGARPLKRVIQKRLVDRLALAMLEGRFLEGDTVASTRRTAS